MGVDIPHVTYMPPWPVNGMLEQTEIPPTTRKQVDGGALRAGRTIRDSVLGLEDHSMHGCCNWGGRELASVMTSEQLGLVADVTKRHGFRETMGNETVRPMWNKL